MAHVADVRRAGLVRVVEEDKPVKNLIAIGLVVVFDANVCGRIEFQIGGEAEQGISSPLRRAHLLVLNRTTGRSSLVTRSVRYGRGTHSGAHAPTFPPITHNAQR